MVIYRLSFIYEKNFLIRGNSACGKSSTAQKLKAD